MWCIVKADVGEDKTLANNDKVALEMVDCLKKHDPNLFGTYTKIELEKDTYALRFFFAFNKSIFVKKVLTENFPKVTLYYFQFIKDTDEKENYEKAMGKANSPTQQRLF